MKISRHVAVTALSDASWVVTPHNIHVDANGLVDSRIGSKSVTIHKTKIS